MDGRKRADIHPGTRVQVAQKQDQRSGKLTEGTVQEILTNSATHPQEWNRGRCVPTRLVLGSRLPCPASPVSMRRTPSTT